MPTHILASELSWLSFNNRILDEAGDKKNPLYERIKFLAIYSSNLDEFYRVKVSSLFLDSSKKKGLLKKVNKEISVQQNHFGEIWTQEIIPMLEAKGIIYYEKQPLEKKHQKEIENYFKQRILAYIQLIYLSLDTEQNYFLTNRKLYLLVKLKDREGEVRYCYVNIPSDKLNRYKLLSTLDDKDYIISIDTIIKLCLHHIFPEQKILDVYAIKINRDENYQIEDETSGNLVGKIKHKIQERKNGSSTRFLYDQKMPKKTIDVCKKAFGLKDNEMVKGGSHHNLFDLFSFPNPRYPSLQNPEYPPLEYLPFENGSSIFDAIENKNHLLHFPYQSYHYVLQLFNEAAVHKDIIDIKITLYRISSQSLIANALISAAKNGKRVTVFVEIKARFDEVNNLFWADEMKKAGITIIYSLPNLKVHGKAALFTMKSGTVTKKYAYFSTGNFNESTATIYSDFGFFTSEKRYTADLRKVFKYLKTKKTKDPLYNLWAAGFNLKENLISHIDKEIENAKKGKKAYIFFKINGLDEKEIIDKLIKANNAGVDIEMIVRGICTLIPGVSGYSENIKIYRIVDMFLEHSRVYKFFNNGDEKMFLSSADLLSRNLNRRIEIAFPIFDKDIKNEINTIIQMQLKDNVKKKPHEGKSIPSVDEDSENPFRSQTETYHYFRSKL
ncbi:polyphosphate kinase 1 [Elizabethkingia anophelis]|uniref:polyphosphate kinase 1 n=1 Tax=Elizabethkingia anophelis TaxID=1117645 RepID=UPI0020B88252|nr:polyphosphate kinase 1 [Elizabethkingia anophelis]UTG62138.1 polyphosphate kinase 1 [Elizabethkingia anophelis]UXM68407.1 polyphosphate kinase 1 [Elizabethkingia anophelis]